MYTKRHATDRTHTQVLLPSKSIFFPLLVLSPQCQTQTSLFCYLHVAERKLLEEVFGKNENVKGKQNNSLVGHV